LSRRAHTEITSRFSVCITLDPEPDERLVRLDLELRGEILGVGLTHDEARKLAETIVRALEVSG